MDSTSPKKANDSRRRDTAPDAAELRRRAEALLRESRNKKTAHSGTKENTRRLLHELRVHQIELEMQNEELRRAPLTNLPIDMKEMAENVFRELLTPETRRRVDVEVGALAPARGDPAMIRQVWTNLISNALKFSSRRERARIVISSNGGSDAAEYSIRDNGAGFDAEYADKLFGVFQRLHSAKDFEGTGVGLAIVKRIVNRHGGRVWADGAPDRGAQFNFSLSTATGEKCEPR